MKVLPFMMLSLFATNAFALSVLSARYERSSDSIVAQVSYTGCGNHRLALEVQGCRETYPVSCDVFVRDLSAPPGSITCMAEIQEKVSFPLKDYDLNDSYYRGASLIFQSGVEVVLPR